MLKEKESDQKFIVQNNWAQRKIWVHKIFAPQNFGSKTFRDIFLLQNNFWGKKVDTKMNSFGQKIKGRKNVGPKT